MAGNAGLWAAVALAGCGTTAPPVAVDVVFGDCAPVSSTFVVGPQPQAL